VLSSFPDLLSGSLTKLSPSISSKDAAGGVNIATGQGDFWWLGTQAFGGQAGNNGVQREVKDGQGSKGNDLT
jgi:hypothetical protein